MKRIIFVLLISLAIPLCAQQYPPYIFLDVNLNPFPNGSGAAIGSNPPYALCYTNVTGQPLPCNFSGGATTAQPLTMNNSGSGAASGTTFDGSVARTISTNTIGALNVGGGALMGTAGTGTPVGSVTMTALGVGGSIPDPAPDWGSPVLGVFDNSNDSASEAAAVPVIPLALYLNWAPTSAIADNQQVNVIQQYMDVNLDGQATATAALTAVSFNVNNQGTATAATNLQGMAVSAINAAPGTNTAGIGSIVGQVTTGTVVDTYGVSSRIDVHAAGTFENIISYEAELYTSSGHLGNYKGFNFDTTNADWSMLSVGNVNAFEVEDINVTGKSTTTACAFCAGSVTGATNNWGIDITGTEPNFLGGPLQAATLTAATARKGTFTCTAAGTITISNANEAATSDVIISLNTAGGTISTPPAMKTVTASTGFTVLCGAADTSVYNYSILN